MLANCQIQIPPPCLNHLGFKLSTMHWSWEIVGFKYPLPLVRFESSSDIPCHFECRGLWRPWSLVCVLVLGDCVHSPYLNAWGWTINDSPESLTSSPFFVRPFMQHQPCSLFLAEYLFVRMTYFMQQAWGHAARPESETIDSDWFGNGSWSQLSLILVNMGMSVGEHYTIVAREITPMRSDLGANRGSNEMHFQIRTWLKGPRSHPRIPNPVVCELTNKCRWCLQKAGWNCSCFGWWKTELNSKSHQGDVDSSLS